MPFRIGLKQSLALQRPFDIDRRDAVFLGERMRKDCDIPSVEEIENPVLNASLLGPEFINAVSQEIRGRPPKLMSELLKELNSDTARDTMQQCETPDQAAAGRRPDLAHSARARPATARSGNRQLRAGQLSRPYRQGQVGAGPSATWPATPLTCACASSA